MKTVFFDIDTQIDFLYPAGALFVPGAQNIVKHLRALTRFAASEQIQIISTADAHSEDDPEFKTWKPHCVVETVGQRKIGATVLPNPLIISTDENALHMVRSAAEDAAQLVIEKQRLDCFTNPNLWPLLDLLRAERYVVYGVVTEYCVRCAVMGLLETGSQVELVTDAIQSLKPAEEQAALERFQAQGGLLTTVSRVTAS